VSKGIGANLLKVGSKRRRTTAQVKQEKLDDEQRELEVSQKLQQFDQLQQQIAQLQEAVKEHAGASEIIKDLMGKGELEIDVEGNVSASKPHNI
jgi:SMC interacting uncharacterized protein involved in chromosome segregation